MKMQIAEMTVENNRVRVSGFEIEFVEGEDSFQQGWLHCYVEILDARGDVLDEYAVRSAVEFHDNGGSLTGSHLNEGLDDKKVSGAIEAAMEEYLDHPDVKKELSDTYEEGLSLAEDEIEGEYEEKDAADDDDDFDAAIKLLNENGNKVLYSDDEEIRYQQFGKEQALLKTHQGWIVTWQTHGGHDWQAECPQAFQNETGLRWASCRDPEELPKLGVQTYRSALAAARA